MFGDNKYFSFSSSGAGLAGGWPAAAQPGAAELATMNAAVPSYLDLAQLSKSFKYIIADPYMLVAWPHKLTIIKY